MRQDPIVERTELASYTPVPPYRRTFIRMKSGLKRTAFFPVIGRAAQEFKLHNTFLKPDRVTDTLEEYWACRRVAGLWDVTGEEAIEVTGPEALAVMNELVPRDLMKLPDGRCLYSVMCYDYGGIVEDGVLIRFCPEKLWWVGGPGFSEQWIYAHALGRKVSVRSLLNEVHVASLQGPQSRAILQPVCAADLTAVPFYGMVETRVCGIPVVVSRTGYTAELGYDIYVAVGDGEALFGGLWEAGRPHGVKLCGSRALNLRRVEASILNFGQDFDWTNTPYQIGLGWMVNLNKPFFRGKEALARVASGPPRRQLIGLRLEGGDPAFGGEAVCHGTTRVGEITSAAVSPTLEASIGIAMADSAVAATGTRLAVDFDGTPVAATVVAMPFFDPQRTLSKA